MKSGFKIIDGHIHTFRSAEAAAKVSKAFNGIFEIEFRMGGTGTAEDALANMAGAGIDASVVSNFATERLLDANNLWTLESARAHRGFIPLVSFHPDWDRDIPSRLEKYMLLGAKGVKIHPMSQMFDPRDPRLSDLYRLCAEAGLPVVFHCGRVSNCRLNGFSDVSSILPVIQNNPGLNVVLTHMADGCAEDVFFIAHAYPNVYFDTSIVVTGYPDLIRVNEPSWPRDDIFLEVVKMVGAGRILFGSDWPWGSAAHDLDRFMKMALPDEDKRLILGANAARLFNAVI